MSNNKFDFNKSSKGFSPKKEKPVKVKKGKAPKAPKPAKVKTPKAFKAPKEPKVPKPVKEKKIKAFKSPKTTTSFDSGKEKKLSPKQKKLLIIIPIVSVILIGLIVAGIILHVNYSNKVAEDGKNIESVIVSATPNNKTYYTGDKEIDCTGLKLEITLKNGSKHVVQYNDETKSEFGFIGFDTSSINPSQKVIVSYKGHNTEFFISVEPRPTDSPRILRISIEALPHKTKYILGESLDTTGGKICVEFTNHPPWHIDLVKGYVSGYEEAEANGPGEYSLIVTYIDEFGIPVQTTYDITIKALASIKIEGLQKTEYTVGDELDTTGGIILIEYTDGSTDTVDLNDSHITNWDEVYSEERTSYAVNVKYEKNGRFKETTFDITIKAPGATE